MFQSEDLQLWEFRADLRYWAEYGYRFPITAQVLLQGRPGLPRDCADDPAVVGRPVQSAGPARAERRPQLRPQRDSPALHGRTRNIESTNTLKRPALLK